MVCKIKNKKFCCFDKILDSFLSLSHFKFDLHIRPKLYNNVITTQDLKLTVC